MSTPPSGSHEATTHFGHRIQCLRCGFDFPSTAPGTRHRNHCPVCLWSQHLDQQEPGDRAADCGGAMEPIAIAPKPDGEWTLIHRCVRCGALSRNRIAGDDDPLPLVALAVRPIGRAPFPLDGLIPR